MWKMMFGVENNTPLAKEQDDEISTRASRARRTGSMYQYDGSRSWCDDSSWIDSNWDDTNAT